MEKNTVCLVLGVGILALTGYALSLGINGIVFASGLASACTLASWVMGVRYGQVKEWDRLQDDLVEEDDIEEIEREIEEREA